MTSRIAKNPISVPAGVTVNITASDVTVKGSKGALSFPIAAAVNITQADGHIHVQAKPNHELADAFAGSARATLQNMVHGVTQGFEKKLELVGVGYRAQGQGKKLNLTLGFSHPVVFDVPEGITIETPTQTEVVIKGMNKQLVGEVAAKIRAYRPPEPYKGKGVRYAGEKIELKEVKKK